MAKRTVCLLQAPHFDLRHTLESGQYFRWTREGDGFLVQHGPRLFLIRQEGGTLVSEGADEAFLHDFFALDHDFPEIEQDLRKDRSLRPALEAYPGLRILRQDPWECLCAFLTSMASNIPRITRNVEDMARTYGRRIKFGSRVRHVFPGPEELGDEAGLRALKVGFRARYLAQAARLARGGLLDEIRQLDLDDARAALMVLPGVAEKVADCLLLFAYGRLEAFPVDTWIRKVMTRLYFKGRRVPDAAIRAFAADRWGGIAGYAQQYLYHWSRSMKLDARRSL